MPLFRKKTEGEQKTTPVALKTEPTTAGQPVMPQPSGVQPVTATSQPSSGKQPAVTSQPANVEQEAVEIESEVVVPENVVGRKTNFRSIAYVLLAFFLAGLTLWSWQDDTLAWEREILPMALDFQPGTVEVRQGDQDWEVLTTVEPIKTGMFMRTGLIDRAEIVFQGRAALRLDSGTEVFFHYLDVEKTKRIDIELLSGQVWVNANDSIDFNVYAGRLWLRPEKAILNLREEVESYEVYVERRLVGINFLEKGAVEAADFSVDTLEDAVWNSFRVAEGLKAHISKNKIDEKLAKLRYSKLVKEFPVSPFTVEDSEENAWFSYNQTRDQELREDFEKTRVDFIRMSGQPGISPDSFYFRLGEMYYAWGDVFVLTEARKNDFQLQQILTPLTEAEFLLATQKPEEGLAKLAIFEETLSGSVFQTDLKLREQMRRFLEGELRELTWVLPGDDFYPMKESINGFLVKLASADQILSLRFAQNQAKLAETYDLLDQRERILAKQTLVQFQRDLAGMLEANTEDLAVLRDVLVDTRRLILNLYWQSGLFYDAENFAYLTQLENKILTFYENPEDQLEERLTYINDRLKSLYRIAALIKVNQLDGEEGISLGETLIEESWVLKEAASVQIGVHRYFDDKLNDFALIFRFFDSLEYLALHGTYDAAAFEEFKEKEKDLEELMRYLLKLEEESPEEVNEPLKETEEQAERAVSRLFTKHQIILRSFMPLPDTNLRLMWLADAEIEGIPFRGKFDRETELIYDLEVAGLEESLTTGVTLNKLGVVLKTLLGIEVEVESPEEVGEEEEEVEPLERTALEEKIVEIILRNLEQYDLLVPNENVILLDISEDLYRLEQVSKLDQPEIIFSFVFNFMEDEVEQVEVETALGAEKLRGTYDLDELWEEVEQVYLDAAAEYQRQLEEEATEEFDLEEVREEPRPRVLRGG